MPPAKSKDSRRAAAPPPPPPQQPVKPPSEPEDDEEEADDASCNGSEASEESTAVAEPPKPEEKPKAPVSSSSSPKPSDALRSIMTNLSHSEFTGFVGREEKNAKFIAINNQQIPCQAHLFRSDKAMAFKITIISARSAGFSKAPYKMSFDKSKMAAINSTAKPLAELETNVNGTSSMHMYLYDKDGAAPDRGCRREDCKFTVEAGDTFVFFVNPKDLARTGMMGAANQAVPVLPTDIEFIPAMSIVEISATTRNVDAATKFRITNVRPVYNFSLISCMPVLRSSLPQSLELARNKMMNKKELYDFLAKDIEEREVCFFIPSVAAGAIVCDDLLTEHKMISIAGWSSNPMDCNTRLDIHINTAMAYTNALTTSFAVTLIQMALEMRAVSFMVFACDYWGRQDGCSHLRAVPLIDTSALLSSIKLSDGAEADGPANYRHWKLKDSDAELDYFEFDTGCFFEDESGNKNRIVLLVGEKQQQQVADAAAVEASAVVKHTTQDFLLSESISTYVPIIFALRDAAHDASAPPTPLLRACFRSDKAMASGTAGGGRYKRAKIGCL